MAFTERNTSIPALDPTSEIIVVHVGKYDFTSFNIHKNLLLSTSEFFKTALKECWTEAAPRVIKLDDVNAEIFKIYVAFLYKQPFHGEFVKHRGEVVNWSILTGSYLLGDRLLDAEFKDVITSQIVVEAKWADNDWNEVPGAVNVTMMYKGTCHGSKGRALFARIFADYASAEQFAKNKNHYPADFVFDVALVHMKNRVTTTTIHDRLDDCRFHEHGDHKGGCPLKRRAIMVTTQPEKPRLS